MVRLLFLDAGMQRMPDPLPGRVDHIRSAKPLGSEDFRLTPRLERFPRPLFGGAIGQRGERGGESHHEPPVKRVPGNWPHRLVSLHPKGCVASAYRPPAYSVRGRRNQGPLFPLHGRRGTQAPLYRSVRSIV